MSLNVSYSQINNGIDAATLKEVTNKIFKRANSENSVLAKADLTKFNRVSLGTDLYSGKVKLEIARQIAVANSGMQVNLSDKAVSSLKYLNGEASKSILKNVDGKINIAETKEITEKQAINPASFGELVEATNLNSDKNGSNPFYKGELLNVTTEEEESEDVLNIFA